MKQQPTPHSSTSWLAWALCLACCWGVSRLSDDVRRELRSTLLDSCLPFQEAKSAAEQLWVCRRDSQDDRLAALQTRYQTERAFWETELRRRELAIAELNSRQQIHQRPEASPFPIVQTDALIDYDVVSAAIVAAEQLSFMHRQVLIESRELTDFERDALVLQKAEPANTSDESDSVALTLDQGQTTGLEPDQPVYAGRCVVGTLSDVGRWISRVRLLTDPEYRGRARILRPVEKGFAYGPEGILEGTGEPLCRLRYLSRTDSVRVGDRVYTNGPVPMYYGQIVRAERDENAPEWNVWIQPAMNLAEIQNVQVLRQLVNPLRQLAN